MVERNYEVAPVRWPTADAELEAAIGRCIIAWAVLETEIGNAVDQILRVDKNVAMAVTANLGAQSLINVFQSLLHTLKENVFEDCDVAAFDKLIARTSIAASKHRNFLAHGRPMLLILDSSEHWVWTHFKSRKGLSGKMMRMRTEDMDFISEEIRAITLEWNKLRHRLVDGVEFMDFSDNC